MEIEAILQRLLSQREDSIAAVLVDEAGETVHLVRAAPGPVDERLAAAGIALCLKHLRRLSEEADLGMIRGLQLASRRVSISAAGLPENHMLALVERAPAVSGVSSRYLEEAADAVSASLFD